MSTVGIRTIENESGDVIGKRVFNPSVAVGAFAGVELDADNNVVAHLIAKQFSARETELTHASSDVHLVAETYADRQELQAPMPLADYLKQYGAALADDLRAALQGVAEGAVKGAHTAALAAKPLAAEASACR